MTMPAIRIGAVWVALMLLGLVSFWLTGLVSSARLGFAAIMIVSGMKALLVAWSYMGIGHASRSWMIAFLVLIAAVVAAIGLLRMLA